MPTYEYRCESCETDFTKTLPMSRHGEPQECPECGTSPAKKLVTGCGFILKGDGWAGKNNRIAGQMRRKNQHLDAKQEERKRDAGIRLAPNVGGERVESWSEAARLASDRGKDTSGYERLARAEKTE
jgi:putative FmdB family regulatory protein